jgi:hypothetical protein
MFKVKLGKVVLKALSRIQTDKFLALTKVDNISNNLSKADVLRANAHTHAGRIFSTPLCFALPFVLTNEQYLAWARSFLGLPPASTIGNHAEQKGFDYPVQKCLAVHRGKSQFLDADGCRRGFHGPASSDQNRWQLTWLGVRQGQINCVSLSTHTHRVGGRFSSHGDRKSMCVYLTI